MRVLSTFVGVVFMVAFRSPDASFLDNDTELSQAIPALRSAIGNHPRVLKIEVDPNVVTIEAQDPNNLKHVNRWLCVDRVLGFIPIRWVTGPEPVDLQLLDPDLEANLFDLDAVAFSATSKLENAAIKRAHIQDPALEQRIATLETDALKKLGESKKVYLESVSIGPHPFVSEAGARAIEVRVRDVPEDSVRAEYGWIVYDFDGRVLDFVTP